MNDHDTTPRAPRNKPHPVETIEQNLDEIHRQLGRELSTPQTGRDAATYQRLADLHRSEAIWWNEYFATARRRVAWLAASAAADRAHHLAAHYQATADGLAKPGGGERGPSPVQRTGRCAS
jgi:hypothetical protein